jgi:hypothetical protein
MFACGLWNVPARVASDLPRTTNGLEGWHSALAKSIRIDHPNIWVLMKQLKQEATSTLLAIAASQVSSSSQSVRLKQTNKYAKINQPYKI